MDVVIVFFFQNFTDDIKSRTLWQILIDQHSFRVNIVDFVFGIEPVRAFKDCGLREILH
ncbi:hypothetical protein D3C72_1235340 [compost metagenome]